jgi:hypothetical protein
MIAAGVPAFGLNIANVKILVDECRYEVRKPGKSVMKSELVRSGTGTQHVGTCHAQD